jgi:hypothetical protein
VDVAAATFMSAGAYGWVSFGWSRASSSIRRKINVSRCSGRRAMVMERGAIVRACLLRYKAGFHVICFGINVLERETL